MRNIRNVTFSMITIATLASCNQTPSVDKMLADPELRKTTVKICRDNFVTMFSKDNKYYELCKTLNEAQERCGNGDAACKKSAK